MNSVTSDSSVVVVAKGHFSCPLGDHVVILDVKAGLYFGLDNVGALVWRLIQHPRSMRDLREAILDAFDVSPEVCERDLVALLQELAAKNLIEIRNEPAA